MTLFPCEDRPTDSAEEAEIYALAIGLLEALTPTTTNPHIKLFATDLSEEAIAVALQGVYPEAAIS